MTHMGSYAFAAGIIAASIAAISGSNVRKMVVFGCYAVPTDVVVNALRASLSGPAPKHLTGRP